MSAPLKDFLSFTKAERIGIFILLFVIFLLLLVNHNLHHFVSKEDFSFSSLDSVKKELSRDKELKNATGLDIKKDYKLFSFDPNSLNVKDWQTLGLSEKQSKIILNYLSKGGKFKVKSDLKKIYSISDEFYTIVEDSILLPDSFNNESIMNTNRIEKHTYFNSIKEKRVATKKAEIFINDSDTSDWKQLYGIGSAYAKRIVNYRSSLGGYVSFNQLFEVWGINDTTIENLRANIVIDSNHFERLNINQLKAEDLKSHPYINWNLANAIVNYRKSHGAYSNLEELHKIHIMNDTLYYKIKPYLTY